MPADAFSLWNMIRDDLDPASESEKVHVKEESEEKKVPVKEELKLRKPIFIPFFHLYKNNALCFQKRALLT